MQWKTKEQVKNNLIIVFYIRSGNTAEVEKEQTKDIKEINWMFQVTQAWYTFRLAMSPIA
jgi:hypothetical protein